MLIFSTAAAQAQTSFAGGTGSRNDTERAIDRILQEFYDRHQLRGGISLAISRRERLVYTGAVGFADRNHTVRLTPQHKMRIGSVSKPITSIAISKLSEEGRLSLDGNVFGTNGIFRNAYGMPVFNGRPVDITVRQLLEHRSGFNRDFEYSSPVTRLHVETPLRSLPGAEYFYSNFGYNVLGRIVEVVTGMLYEKYVQEHILRPCGIDGMRIGADRSGPDEVEYINVIHNLAGNPSLPYALGPAGGWIASPVELLKFMAHVDTFSNVPDILRNDTPRIRIHSHSGNLGYANWALLQRDSDGFTWALLMNYVPPNWEQIDRPAMLRQIKNAIREWPIGIDLSGVSDTSIVRTPYNDFYFGVLSYRWAAENMEIVVNENFTLDQLISIDAPWTDGAALTIRSANPARLVTLTRGASGNLFTIASGASVIFRDIIIDGGGTSGGSGAFADNGGGTLVRVNGGGAFTMNAGTALRNNMNMVNNADGGAVAVTGTGTFTMNGGTISGNSVFRNGGGVIVTNSAVFTMNGGTISGNTANNDGGGLLVTNAGSTFNLNGGEISGNTGRDGGGIRLSGGTFTMRDGRISGNTASLGGGGASVSGSNSVFNINGGGIAMWSNATINMIGGEIIGNNAPNGSGVRRAGGTFNLNGGVVAGTGSALTNVVNSAYNLNNGAPNNAIVIAWNRPAGTSSEASRGTLNYTAGANTHLTVSSGGTAAWQNQNGVLGISYTNGANRGWIRAW
ncbi:MAG: serine hydrolase [Treponema sp.]|nr:serine hydrolase [Treponema sp.]